MAAIEFTKIANTDPRLSKVRTDWSKCCLYQKSEELKSLRAQQPQEHDGYTMIATNIPLFHEINEMPIVLNPASRDDGGGIDKALMKSKAQYHQSRHHKFNNTKLERARKRRAECAQPVECPTKLRKTSLEDLYNRERTYLRTTKRLEQEHAPKEEFSVLVTYVVETTRSDEGPAVFRLADIVHLYAQRLEQLGVDAPAVNSTICTKEQQQLTDTAKTETPFPVYMGMSVYTKTRRRTLVEMLNVHCIIIHDRVLELSAQLGNATVSKYVCPSVLCKGLFTISAKDNIDHNPTATTATISFHGTSVFVFQHLTKEDKGEEHGQLKVREEKVQTVPELPDSFTKKKPSPTQSGVTHPDTSLLRPQLSMEYDWLEKITVTDGPVDVTWSAHQASQKREKPFEVSITSYLPLLRDQAHSVVTVKHVMDKIKEIVAFLNPDRVPVIAADQPIYAVAKQVQWHWPEIYGKDKFVIMFGGLHIEWRH
ncbi:hypothetical protein Pcinc_032795 [Petrolisthes cinctipes]|uniref:Uncharacterized protein n=1 Tax=Petrolisthes cinctipes TaxID=88211 RepID=A0AAE1K0P5_PETCI|nr:hypothetical protein Pcinc_032795 [Petrolisthes cinctipes]